MILTGKCKEDFIDFLWSSKFNKEDYKEYESYLDSQKDRHTLADIIEWFDSVGIYINVENINKGVWFEFTVDTNLKSRILFSMDSCSSRQDATKKAIIQANEFYNEQINNYGRL